MVRTPQRAFTLIELLVVISIIALIIGIILPALGAARKRARIIACTTNVKNTTTAMLIYLNENHHTFPASNRRGFDGDPNDKFRRQALSYHNLVGQKGVWTKTVEVGKPGQTEVPDRMLNSYIEESLDVAECPLDKGDSEGGGLETAFNGWGTSYAYTNRQFTEMLKGTLRGISGTWVIEGHKANKIRSPTKKMLLADTIFLSSRSAADEKNLWHNAEESLLVSMSFADGHAGEVPRKAKGHNFQTGPHDIDDDDIAIWRTNELYY